MAVRRRPRTIHTFDAFLNGNYRLLWASNFFAYISRWMQMTMLGWFVFEETGSPFLVTVVGFSGMGPLVVLGVFGGVLAEQVDKRRLLLGTLFANLAAASLMAALIFSDLILDTDLVRFWHAYLVMLVGGIGWGLDMPSRRSIVLDVLGRERVNNAVALDSIGMHSSRMLGPLLGGALITASQFLLPLNILFTLADRYEFKLPILNLQFALPTLVGSREFQFALPDGYGLECGYAATLLFFIASAAMMLNMRMPRRAETAAPVSMSAGGVLRNLNEGFRYVWGEPTLRAVVLITVFMNLLLFPYQQLIPVVAEEVLMVGATLMGMLLAFEGLGALTGAALIASASNMTHHGRVYFGGSMFGLLMLLLFSFSQWYGVSLALMLLLGLGTAGFGTMQATIVLLVAREDMRGRGLGIITLAIGAGPIGALMLGAIAESLGAPIALTIIATLGLLTVGLVGLLLPTLRGRMTSDTEAASGTA